MPTLKNSNVTFLVISNTIDHLSKNVLCGQTVLPDKSLLIRQKLVENAKIEKFKCDNSKQFSYKVNQFEKETFL